MESFEDSNCHSMTDSFSLYERYLRSFSVVDSFVDDNREEKARISHSHDESSESNIQLSVNKRCDIVDNDRNQINTAVDIGKIPTALDTELCLKTEDSNLCASPAAYLDNSSATADHSLLTEKSDATDAPASSEDSKPECFKQPVFITPTMENSNNAVDSVPLLYTRPSGNVFKLPISELSFNGTIKHVQKLKPIVDPITALTSNAALVNLDDRSVSSDVPSNVDSDNDRKNNEYERISDSSADKVNESTGDSQYEECIKKRECVNEDGSSKWNEQSYSSLEASFDSGVRSPDMFTDEDEAGPAPVDTPFWSFLKDFEAYDKRRVRKLEGILRGLLPPPSVTTLKTDVTEMLRKYYSFLPSSSETKVTPEANATTPTKRVSFVEILNETLVGPVSHIDVSLKPEGATFRRNSTSDDKSTLDRSTDKSIDLKMGTEIEARESLWPDVMKCRHYDVYYNTTQYTEKYELLSLRLAERYVGAETDSSVNVHSGGLQSPSSASKRKAMRMKLAQAKSPGRRLSHLARRRQAFCSAATIGEKANASNSRLVLIDKNFFPHRKLISSAERKSPRTRRTPGKKTPNRKTPGKKTPAKTPKSGGSSRKKAMRRLLMDTETLSRSQPTRETLKRALFISPDNRKPVPQAPSSSVPLPAMKSKRALFGSPITAETKSCDGTQSDQFMKRKLDALDEVPESSRCKVAKSLSFGGDSIGASHGSSFLRRSSEVFTSRNPVELNETHKKKLLWAVSEALRVHGWRMQSPGFKEKASTLARLTRRLLTLPPHAARLAAPKLSTSETMLRLARQYVFAIIQGRTVEECFNEEQMKLANDTNTRITGYISASAYQQLKTRQTTTSQIKENCDENPQKQDQHRSASKNILQDKLVNIDTNSNSRNIDSNSNSSSGMSMIDKTVLFKSNSMPSFEEAAKLRARRQISFDNVDFPKR